MDRQTRRLPPPCGLNNAGLLRLGSASLGLSPQRTTQLAEELYQAGLISYPRTTATGYPASLDLRGTLSLLAEQPTAWGSLAAWLYAEPPQPLPTRGEATGEHPPIMPVGRGACLDGQAGACSGGQAGACGRLARALYEAVCAHFVASVLPEAVYDETRAPRRRRRLHPLPATPPLLHRLRAELC